MRRLDGFVRVVRSNKLPAIEGLDSYVHAVRVGEERVLVARMGNRRVVAFGAFCPHEMTDLRRATFVDGRVRCPMHNYLYDPLTGANLVPTKVVRPENLWKLRPGFLPIYAVEERDGWVWVSETPSPPPPGWDPASEERPDGAVRNENPSEGAATEPAVPAGAVEHPTKTLRVRAGARFDLRLPTEPKPGHVWKIDVPPGILTVVDQRFEADTPPRQRIRIAADAVGEGMVRCSYGRPWDADPVEIRTYKVLVVSG